MKIMNMVPSRSAAAGQESVDYLGQLIKDTGAYGVDITAPSGTYTMYKNRNERHNQLMYARVSINGCCGAGYFPVAKDYTDYGSDTQGIVMFFNQSPEDVYLIAEKRNMEVVEIPVGNDKVVYLFAKEET
jgi:hypothetical protein